MKIGARQHGRLDSQRVRKSYQFAGPDTITSIPFDNFPTSQNGMELVITDLYLKLPTASFTVGAGFPANQSYIDGLLQTLLFGFVTLQGSDQGPQCVLPCGQQLLQTEDVRQLETRAFMAGKPINPMFDRGFRPYENVVPANSQTPLSGFSREIRGRDVGWVQSTGPYAQIPALVGGTVSYRPQLRIPFWRKGEPWGGEMPLPARWLSGEKCGCKGSAPGQLQFTAPGALPFPGGALPISWGAENVNLYAVGYWTERDKVAHPMVPFTRRVKYLEGEYTLFPWAALMMCRAMPALLADGSMPISVYGELDLMLNGQILRDRDPEQFGPQFDVSSRVLDTGDSPFAYAQVDNQQIQPATFPGPGGSIRTTRWGVTAFQYEGSLLDAPGDAAMQQRAILKFYGDIDPTTSIVEGGYFGPTAESLDRHASLYGLTGSFTNDTADGSPPSKPINGGVPVKPASGSLKAQ